MQMIYRASQALVYSERENLLLLSFFVAQINNNKYVHIAVCYLVVNSLSLLSTHKIVSHSEIT